MGAMYCSVCSKSIGVGWDRSLIVGLMLQEFYATLPCENIGATKLSKVSFLESTTIPWYSRHSCMHSMACSFLYFLFFSRLGWMGKWNNCVGGCCGWKEDLWWF